MTDHTEQFRRYRCPNCGITCALYPAAPCFICREIERAQNNAESIGYRAEDETLIGLGDFDGGGE